MVVNSVPCPTVRRITGIKLNGDYDTDNWWGIAGENTCNNILDTLVNGYRILENDISKDVEDATHSWASLFPPDSEVMKTVPLEGHQGCMGSYLEAWSYNLEWQAKEQVELHTMEIYEGYKHIYGEKLESALSKIEDSVKTGIEYGSVISWELTGAMWTKMIAAVHSELDASLKYAKLMECPQAESKEDCVHLSCRGDLD